MRETKVRLLNSSCTESDKPGLNYTSFNVVFDRNWFKKDDIIRNIETNKLFLVLDYEIENSHEDYYNYILALIEVESNEFYKIEIGSTWERKTTKEDFKYLEGSKGLSIFYDINRCGRLILTLPKDSKTKVQEEPNLYDHLIE